MASRRDEPHFVVLIVLQKILRAWNVGPHRASGERFRRVRLNPAPSDG